jgi:hypothetical protein
VNPTELRDLSFRANRSSNRVFLLVPVRLASDSPQFQLADKPGVHGGQEQQVFLNGGRKIQESKICVRRGLIDAWACFTRLRLGFHQAGNHARFLPFHATVPDSDASFVGGESGVRRTRFQDNAEQHSGVVSKSISG